MDSLIDIICINLYWLSLPAMGYALLHLARSIKTIPEPVRLIATFVLRQHIFTVFLYSTALVFFIYAAISIPFYLFALQVKYLVFIYILLMIITAFYLAILFSKRMFTASNLDFFKLRERSLLTKSLTLLVVVMLIVDFIIALYVKSYPAGDATYHMSRLLNILNEGFNVRTSFFDNLQEGAYHFNVMYALYAVPAKMFSLEPSRVWEYSFAFFRLIQWLAIFTLGFHIFQKWMRANVEALPLALLGVISAICFFSFHFFIATYPNQVVVVWLILLVIAMYYYVEKVRGMGSVLIALGAVITMIHPTYALIAACFIGLYLLLSLFINRQAFLEHNARLLTYVATLAILMSGPLYTKLLPSKLNSSQLHLDEPPLIHAFGMYFKQPIDIFPKDYISFVLLFFGIIAVATVMVVLWRRKVVWPLAFSLIFLSPIVLYTPVAFTVLYQFLPVWILERFSSMNILVYIVIPIGMYGLYAGSRKLFFKSVMKRDLRYLGRGAYVLCVIAVLALCIPAAVTSYTQLLSVRSFNKETYSRMDMTAKDLSGILKDDKIIVADRTQSYYLNAIFHIDVVAVEAGHSPLTADATHRISCQSYVMENFRYSDLKAIHADYVVIPTHIELERQHRVADARPYLRIVARNQEFIVYEFDRQGKAYDNSEVPYPPCEAYQRLEV